MVETIFTTPFVQSALIFVLVFTIVFGILQKSQVFGAGKKQIDALVALAIGLIVLSVAYATDLIHNLIPFLAVSLVIILVFMILIGSFHSDKLDLPGWAKIVLGIIVFISVIIAVLYFTGAWDYLYSLFTDGDKTSIWGNIVIIIFVVGAILAVVLRGKKSP